MPRAPPVALLRPVLEDSELGPALVSGDLGLDLDLLEVLAEHHLLVAEGDWAEVDHLALLRGEAIDDEGRALLDAVLLAACLDHCVAGHGRFSQFLEPPPARDRRLPPLLPRRLRPLEVEDSTFSPRSPLEPAGTTLPSLSSSNAVAAE